MKRFYCKICRKVKRVRKYPADIINETNEIVEQRVGSCTRHSMTFTPSVTTKSTIKRTA